jgi:adenylate cyclase
MTDHGRIAIGSARPSAGFSARMCSARRSARPPQRSLDLHPDDPGILVNAACLHAKLRQKEEALALLERVFAQGRGKRAWVEHDPDYDILRDDPRFQQMLARLK